MSEASFKRAFDAQFFEVWAGAMGEIVATYTAPFSTPVVVDVLVDTDIEQFGLDGAPVSTYDTYIAFRRQQIEPVQGAAVIVDGVTYTLAQRVRASDESLSRWGVQRA